MFKERKGSSKFINHQFYICLKPMNKIERNADIDLFKEEYQPFLEICLDSGC